MAESLDERPERGADPEPIEAQTEPYRRPIAPFVAIGIAVLIAAFVFVAAGLAFAVALGEFGATVFVSRADWPTVPVAIFRFLGRPGADNVGAAMALSVVLMLMVTAVALASERSLVRGRPR